MMKRPLTLIGILLLIGLLSFQIAWPLKSAPATNVIVVTNTVDIMIEDGTCSLREAVHNANTNSAFSVMAGECPAGSDAVTDVIVLSSGSTYILSLIGAGDDQGELDILSGTPFLEMQIETAGGVAPATIEQIAPNERVINVGNGASLTLENVEVTGGDVTGTGGGINMEGGIGSVLTLVDVIVSFNSATTHGGGIAVNGTALLYNSQILVNDAGSQGGGIYVASGVVEIYDSLIRENGPAINGGGLFAESTGATRIVDSTFLINQATQSGGGMYLVTGGSHSIRYTEIRQNSADSGGGIYTPTTNPNEVVIENSRFYLNDATTVGGGLAGSATIEFSEVLGNTAETGAGLFGASMVGGQVLHLSDVAIVGNIAQTNGGGIVAERLFGNYLYVAHNSALNGNGGGMMVNYFEVADSQFVHNYASDVGGGLLALGLLFPTETSTLVRTLVAYNSTDEDAGGVGVDRLMAMANVTISSNQTVNNGSGLYVAANGDLAATNITVARHLTEAIYNIGSFTLQNSIIANLFTDSCAAGGGIVDIVSLGNNIVDDTTCGGVNHGSDLTDEDAMLAPLANNGGPTMTHALQTGSPAIDGGNNTACAGGYMLNVDQRLAPRPFGANCDVGAFENVWLQYLPIVIR